MKKLQGWMVGGIAGLVAFIILTIIVYIMNISSAGAGDVLWDFFSKIYLTSSLGDPVLDIITIIVRWALIGAIVGLLFDLGRKKY